MKRKLVLGVIAFLTFINYNLQPVRAGEEQTEVKRFSLEVGAGYNVILPFIHVRTSYRLPAMNDSLAFFADYSPVNVLGFPAPVQAGLIGIKYYFPGPSGVYLDFGAGAGFRYGAQPAQGHDTSNFIMPAVVAGIGTDLMITKNFGISLELNASYPFIARGTGNIKLAF
jgi:hypothetical protein